MEITAGAVAIALIGGGILVALGLDTRKAKRNWLGGVLKNVEDRMNEVTVRPLSKAEAETFLKPYGGDVVDFRALHEQIVYGKDKPMSDIVMFTIPSNHDSRDVIWYMNIKTNEFYVSQFRIGDSRERKLAFDYRLRLKEIGNQAFVMWKMGSF